MTDKPKKTRIGPNPAETVALEHQLYKARPDLWAVSKVLEHAPRLKKALWELLEPDDQQLLRGYALKRLGQDHGSE